VEYRWARTYGGDAFITASVESTGERKTEQNMFYKRSQPGASVGGIVVMQDDTGASNSGYWHFRVNFDTGTLDMTYHDDDNVGSINDTFDLDDTALCNTY
jgi:hypothetical protein